MTGTFSEADDEERDFEARFAAGCWRSPAKLTPAEVAEFGSESAFLFIAVCKTGRCRGGGGGGSDRGFWVAVPGTLGIC